MSTDLYKVILKKKQLGKKLFAILIDPDKFQSPEVIRRAERSKADFILVGGSLLTNGSFEECISTIKQMTDLPVIIFPGNNLQISKNADAILLLSLISGRNPEFLIGKHVVAAPLLKSSELEIIPTGYMLIESGKQTTASYMSNTVPIPHDKTDIAVCTALAGEMLGLKLIYMDAGSGALTPVGNRMIKQVCSQISIPLIVGGGINTPQLATAACEAGADIVVVGNAIEKDIDVIEKISNAIHEFNTLNLSL
ncbi:MAG TPA: geranylgeranylglyceryl/heptaprenylglyceryl phosphate synthase [Bacteroidia bacterium]|jgi:putative glycerol-1-phosphate prenyltransferase|nr:geranylgeranylglyceryl/heptaprenylglyceryl phosphate synthase [Bacteroidia bacterium]